MENGDFSGVRGVMVEKSKFDDPKLEDSHEQKWDIFVGHFTNDFPQKSGHDFYAVNAKTATTSTSPKESCNESNSSSTTQPASQFSSMTPNEIHDLLMSNFVVLLVQSLNLSHSQFKLPE